MTTGDTSQPESSGHRPPGEPAPDAPQPDATPTPSEPGGQQAGGQQPGGQQPGGQQPGGQQPGGQQAGGWPPGGCPPGQPYPPPPGAAQAPLSPQDERTWAMAAHFSALVGMIIGLAFMGPLVVMLVQGPRSPYVRANAVEALNFNLSVLIYFIVSLVLSLILIGLLLMVVVGVAWLVLTIIAGVKTGNGEAYRYPLTIRMVS